MNEGRDVVPINALVGMPVLSRVSGNKLGEVRDLFVDQINGMLNGLTVTVEQGTAALPYDEIHSFGRDAVMANADNSLQPVDEAWLSNQPNAKEHLIGTKVITESGRLLGSIANVFVTAQPPPFVVYEIRESMLDKLLGRQTYILPSDGYALSNDKERLVVPDTTAETAASNITTLIDQALTVRTFSPSPSSADNYDDTWVRPTVDDDETIIRVRDEEETVLRPPRTVD